MAAMSRFASAVWASSALKARTRSAAQIGGRTSCAPAQRPLSHRDSGDRADVRLGRFRTVELKDRAQGVNELGRARNDQSVIARRLARLSNDDVGDSIDRHAIQRLLVLVLDVAQMLGADLD